MKSSLDWLNVRIKYLDFRDSMVNCLGEIYLSVSLIRKAIRTAIVMIKDHVDWAQTYDILILGLHQFLHVGYLTMTL